MTLHNSIIHYQGLRQVPNPFPKIVLVLSSMQMRRARLIIIGKVCLAYGDNHFTHANFASRSQFCQTSNTSSVYKVVHMNPLLT